MRVALDTNVLAYAEGVNTAVRRAEAQALLARLPEGGVVVPAQVLGELYRVLTRKGGASGESARAALMSWADAFEVEGTTPDVLMRAADLAASHQIDIWGRGYPLYRRNLGLPPAAFRRSPGRIHLGRRDRRQSRRRRDTPVVGRRPASGMSATLRTIAE